MFLLFFFCRYQPVRHPRQACHNHAQRYAAGAPHPWGTCLIVVECTTKERTVFLNTTAQRGIVWS